MEQENTHGITPVAAEIANENGNSPLTTYLSDLIRELEKTEEKVESCKKNAEQCLVNAHNACKEPAHLFNLGQTVNALQTVATSFGESQVALSDAQALFFKQQQIIYNAIKWLTSLSATDLDTVRKTVKEIRRRLFAPDKKPNSKYAQIELQALFDQLSNQLSLLEKLEKLKKSNGKITEKIAAIEKNVNQIKELKQQLRTVEESKAYKAEVEPLKQDLEKLKRQMADKNDIAPLKQGLEKLNEKKADKADVEQRMGNEIGALKKELKKNQMWFVISSVVSILFFLCFIVLFVKVFCS